MPDGVDMEYGSDGIRAGGSRAGGAGDAADSAVGHLLRGVIGPSAFGDVEGGDAVVSGLGDIRDAHARLGHDVAASHVAIDADARTVAGMGDELEDTTAAIARTATPGAITDGMRG